LGTKFSVKTTKIAKWPFFLILNDLALLKKIAATDIKKKKKITLYKTLMMLVNII